MQKRLHKAFLALLVLGCSLSSILLESAEAGVERNLTVIGNLVLPSGAIDTDKMSSDSITAAKLITGAVETSKIHSSALIDTSKQAATGQLAVGTLSHEGTLGVTIDQGGADNAILSLQSTDVTHGRTSLAKTGTYASFFKNSGTDGGLAAYFISEGDATGVNLSAIMGSANPTDTTPAFILNGSKADGGTGSAALGAAETVFQFRNFTTNLVTVLGDGKTGFGTVSPASSVDITATTVFGGSDVGHLRLADTATPAKRLGMGYDVTTGVDGGYIQAIHGGVGQKGLLLNPTGGNVSIGRAITPATLLHISSGIVTIDGTAHGLVVAPPAVEDIAAGAVITANACGSVKRIIATGAQTTNTTNTFTAPAAANAGCCMDVVNTDSADAITLDTNANFFSAGAADVVLGIRDSVRVCSDGSVWTQIGGTGNN